MDTIEGNVTSNDTKTSDYTHPLNLSHTFLFWYYLLLSIISIPAYLFILIYTLVKKTERQALHNHPILVVLFFSFCLVIFDYTWFLDSVRNNEVPWLQNTVFCQIWWLFDYGFYGSVSVILAWTSFERHILIFYAGLVRTRRGRILIHYLPLFVVVLYVNIFYIYVIFFPPCQNLYDFTGLMCGGYPCYSDIQYLLQWELIGHGITPTFIITFFNVTLLIRVLRQKRHRRQNWRKCRKMAFQLLSISALFLSLDLPMTIIHLVQTTGDPNWTALEQSYFIFFSTLIHYFLPFICLASLPMIWRKLKSFFTRNNQPNNQN